MNLNDKFIVAIQKFNMDIPSKCGNCIFGDNEIYTMDSLEEALAKKIEKLQEKGTMSARIFKQINVEVVEKEIDKCTEEENAKGVEEG